MKPKFQKLSWGCNPDTGGEKFVIIQPLDESSPEVQHHLEEYPLLTSDEKGYVWGKLVYGSRIQYDKSGRIFYFKDTANVTDLDDEYVLNEYFTGLI